jgi:hypothetical protein
MVSYESPEIVVDQLMSSQESRSSRSYSGGNIPTKSAVLQYITRRQEKCELTAPSFCLSSCLQVDISKSTNFRGYMGLLTENNNPFVPTSAYLLINSDNKGDYHEAFNLGLDPSLGFAVEESGGEGELEHGDNLWPDKEVWSGAERFVSC